MSTSTTTQPLRVYIGWDPGEDDAYKVAEHSLVRHASVPVEVIGLRQGELRAQGLYWRDRDPLAATEFTYTRFLVPRLAGYEGWALFCDCDFLWLDDVAKLFAMADERYAVMCAKHDHRPRETVKMNDCVQTVYPRKNWSSLVLYNCGHAANRALTDEVVNREPGSFLHQFRWLQDDQIGDLPKSWNWLEGWDEKPAGGPPNVVHYTRGGPWFDNWQHVDYADLWCAEMDRVRAAQGAAA